MIYQDSKNFVFDLFQKIQKDAAVKISDEEKMQLEAIYKRINFKDFERCNCKNLYQDLVVSLCIFFKQNAAFPKPRRWSMQRGAIISCPVVAAGVATANNLTDEAAEWIKENEPKFFNTFIFENPYYEPDEDSITTDADDSAEEATPIFENPYYEPDEDSITTDADDSAEEATPIFENPYYEPDEDSITTDADDSAEEAAPKKVGRPKKN